MAEEQIKQKKLWAVSACISQILDTPTFLYKLGGNRAAKRYWSEEARYIPVNLVFGGLGETKQGKTWIYCESTPCSDSEIGILDKQMVQKGNWHFGG